ncbi:MAG TPA: hypothetical protein VFY90_02700 [Tepidiformaceae bacterium]|nr:hypothetical protein [Tepidiformaceae bacterium]
MAMSMMRGLGLAAGAVGVAGTLTASVASAQIPWPPATVFGSVTDEAGPVPEKVRVEAYIGDKLCGEGETGYTGDGDSRVTVYFADVVSDQQIAGCGKSGVEVRLKVGDRFASQTFKWETGPAQVDIVFGNATPAPIPTFTPTPQRTATPTADGTQSPGAPIGGVATIPAGSPGAGSPIPTRPGGITSSTPQASNAEGDGGGFPIWALAIVVFGGIAAAGGGVGFIMSRNRAYQEDPFMPPSDVE